MGIVAAIFVMGSSPDQFVDHAFKRSAVIFIGLAVATTVNFSLLKPRYRERFNETLRSYSREASSFFISSVVAFINLKEPDREFLAGQLNSLHTLQKECRDLAAFYAQEKLRSEPAGEVNTDDGWLDTASAFLEYNRELVDRAAGIYELLPVRILRRTAAGEQPFSKEFQAILGLLEASCETVTRLQDKLQHYVCDRAVVVPEPISEDFWEQFSKAVEEWQTRFVGSYYLHALLELSVVAADIRWAARQAKTLLLQADGKQRKTSA